MHPIYLVAVLSLAAWTGSAAAQSKRPPVSPVPSIKVDPGALRIAPHTARRTAFDPVRHGFKFVNTFANNVVDYFNNRDAAVPSQNYEPGEGTTLRRYLYDRQVQSIQANIDKWAELSTNPFGARNATFYQWGLEGPNGRLDHLRHEIDSGRPVPLGLKGCNEGCNADHQVLAIGYDIGGYTGDMGPASRQVRIFVYDPNFPGRTMTLSPFPEASQFRYVEADGNGHRRRWRTYFVDQRYSPRRPPEIVQAARELVLRLRTGGDDLRGGNDNLHLHVLLASGRTLRFENVNNARRWINNSSHTVSVPLPPDASPADIRGVRLETTFGGGIGGDNWNLDKIEAWTRDEAGDEIRFTRTGAPLFRFTGQQRVQEFAF
jgi:hypothetical protein